jgi:4-amino-4-deoxy-L-arabinose transferase-like glycosyltransferase
MVVFRSLLHVGFGSPHALRVAAAAAAALVTLATLAVAVRVAGRIVGYSAAVLMATFGASPYLESFTLAGELLSALPAVLSLLAFTQYLRARHRRWLLLAGLLTGCALMIKQSAFDAGLAILAYLVIAERRRVLPSIALLLAGTAVPIAAAALSAASPGAWFSAVVSYRWRGDSIVTGSPMYRLELFGNSFPAAAYALALLAFLAALGWRRAPLLPKLWLAAAVVGVIGGGNFHYHYYLQLVAPLAVLGGVGVVRIVETRNRIAAAAAAALAAGTVAVTAPLWFESPSAQARSIWSRDPHLVQDRAVARYVTAHTGPHDKIFVIWGAASIYYLADRDPALRYMWLRNIQRQPGALTEARHLLAHRIPRLVVVAQKPSRVDKAGVTGRLLRTEYERAATIEGVPIYRPRPG